jgi:hypothetical protein
MSEPTIEILEPEWKPHPRPTMRKYIPVLLWGTIIALPAMHMTSSIFEYKTAKVMLEIEKLKAASETLTQQ